MRYTPFNHHRRSIRLPHYDYSQSGNYFITVCAKGHLCRFGEIVSGRMALNAAGEMIRKTWEEIVMGNSLWQADCSIVMPNHFHAILVINKKGGNEIRQGCDQKDVGVVGGTKAGSVGRIIQGFKSITTLRYIQNVKQLKLGEFDGKLWQRNYYEHVIRNEQELNDVREYIINNPVKWELDEDNPGNCRRGEP